VSFSNIRPEPIPLVIGLSVFCPILGAFFDYRLFTFLPQIGLFILIGASILENYKYFCSPTRNELVFIFALIVLSVMQLVTQRGIASGGTIFIIFYVFIFRRLLASEKDIYRIHNWVYIFYLIHLIALISEFFLAASGNQYILDNFFGNTSNSAGYKSYNSAFVMRQVFDLNVGGLNSLLLGSQGAGTIAAGVFIFSLMQYIYERNSTHLFVAVLGAILYVVCANQTINFALLFLGLGAIVITLIVLPLNKPRYYFYSALLLAAIIVGFGELGWKVITFKLHGNSLNIYLETFAPPLIAFLDLSVIDQLFGVGRKPFAMYNISSTDFGLMSIIFLCGLLFALMIIIPLVFLLVDSIKYLSSSVDNKFNAILALHLMLAFLWLISLVHYTKAVELGGRELLATHIALAYSMLVLTKHHSSKLSSH